MEAKQVCRAPLTRPTILHEPSGDRTVIWNLSKRADNAAGLVQPDTFDMLLDLLCRDDEEGDVLRRIVSCIQNLASMRRYALVLRSRRFRLSFMNSYLSCPKFY